jgi:hypothetical protein
MIEDEEIQRLLYSDSPLSDVTSVTAAAAS